ncbi:MAG: glycosyltransferase family 4 protein, partial [Actinobacteria bacterium]|nr:glycosyltransferase family 4 protein [Actinomycetota bacterium]
GSGVRHLRADNVAQAVAQTARCRRFDVIHAHMTSAEWAVVATHFWSRAATVSTRHFAAERGRSRLVRRLSWVVPRVLDEQVAVSAFVADAIGQPAVVLPNGVPQCQEVKPRTKTVLVLQRLEAEKHTDVALEAWARTESRHRGWKLLVAGAGSQDGSLRRRAADLALDGAVEFLGHRSDAPMLLQTAGVLLATAPSEPFGLSVVEAMAAGLAVVAAGGGAHLETVGSCTSDFLFPVDDADACAARLDTLVGNDTLRSHYGKALQIHQRAHFDLDVHADRLLTLYRRLVEERHQRRRLGSRPVAHELTASRDRRTRTRQRPT